jgi:membrane protease YdiL (CAAX protease family)
MSSKSLHIFTKHEAYFLVASGMFMGLFISLLFQGISSGPFDTALVDRLIVLFGELAILVPPLIILKQRKVSVKDVLPLHEVSPLTFIMAIVFVAGAIGMVTAYELIMLPYFPIPEFLKQLETELSQGGVLEILILIIAGSIAAPIVEEFLFRGVLQQSLFYKYGSILPAMVVPTVIFALFHVAYLFYLPAFIELLALAFMLAWLMVKTGNILIPIIVHGLFNLSSLSDLFIPTLEDVNTVSELGLAWVITSVLLILIAWIYFKNMPNVVLDRVYLIPPLREKEG